METFSALLAIWAGNSPVTGEFPVQRPVTRSFHVFFALRLINGWANNREAGDLGRHRTHYDVIVMLYFDWTAVWGNFNLCRNPNNFDNTCSGLYRNSNFHYSTKAMPQQTTIILSPALIKWNGSIPYSHLLMVMRGVYSRTHSKPIWYDRAKLSAHTLHMNSASNSALFLPCTLVLYLSIDAVLTLSISCYWIHKFHITHIIQGCFTGTGTIVCSPRRQWTVKDITNLTTNRVQFVEWATFFWSPGKT